jgi:hypothetical protein
LGCGIHYQAEAHDEMKPTSPNKRASVDAGFGILLAIGRQWPGTTEHGRSATLQIYAI